MNILHEIEKELSQKCNTYIECFTEIEDFPCKDDKTFKSFLCVRFDDLKEVVKHKFESTPKSADAFMILQDHLLFVEFKNPWKKSFGKVLRKFPGIENGRIEKTIKESLEKEFELREIVIDSLRILNVILGQEAETITTITRFYFIFSFRTDFLENIELAVPHLKLITNSPDNKYKFLTRIRNTVIEIANRELDKIGKELKLQECKGLSCEDFKIFLIFHKHNFIYPATVR